jgi:lysophospholipase L1-like esterase
MNTSTFPHDAPTSSSSLSSSSSMPRRAFATSSLLLLSLATACTAEVEPTSCSSPPYEETPVSEQVVNDLSELRQARVFFLHHSVGQNVLDAIARLDGAVAGAGWPIVGIEQASGRNGGLLVETSGGKNTAPTTKIDAFVSTLLEQPGLRPDVAMMKLCYVDFTPDTDVEALFSYYRDSVRALRQLRPGLRVVHVTVPLKARPDDARARVRRALRLQVWEDAANARRAAYNAKLRDAFAAEPVFDLAAFEARGPTDAPTKEVVDSVPALDPRFTDDGGHLNPTGARFVAVAWLRFLADVVRTSRAAQSTTMTTAATTAAATTAAATTTTTASPGGLR